MGMRAEYINRTRPKLSATPQNVLPERIENLVTTVKRSWETATEGVEKPVYRLLSLYYYYIIYAFWLYNVLTSSTLETGVIFEQPLWES